MNALTTKIAGKEVSNDDKNLTSLITAKCNPADKALWVRAAKSKNMKLADWVVATLNNAAVN